jgi:dethiobiotin synthetase
MIGLFITGTDTGVGKTCVTAAVARLLRQQGRVVVVSKPVATGAERHGDRWLSEDTLRLAAAEGLETGFERITPWSFPEPVAPPVAAREHGVTLTLANLAAAVRERVKPGAAVLVEGVGGLLCPLTMDETVADLVRELNLPLVVVARRSLGTLNHTLLTLEVARSRGLMVAGVVVNTPTPPKDDLAGKTNVEELRRRISVPVLAVVSYTAPGHNENLTPLAAVDWWRICHQAAGHEDFGSPT